MDLWTPSPHIIVPRREPILPPWPGWWPAGPPRLPRLPRPDLPPLWPTIIRCAITASNLLAAGDTTNQAVYTTASQTPPANQLILGAITSQRSTIDAAPTLAGNGLTWVQVATATFNTIAAPNRRITVFRAMGASPTAGAVTITFPSVQQGAAWIFDAFAGVATGGTDGSAAVRQPTPGNIDAATVLMIALGAFASVNNGTYGAFAASTGGASSFTPGTGFSELAETGFSTPLTRLCSEWRADNDTTVDATKDASSDLGGIALELVAAAAGIVADDEPWRVGPSNLGDEVVSVW